MREAQVINRYLQQLDEHGGRTLNVERLQERLLAVTHRLESRLTGVQRIYAVQERDDIVAQLEAADRTDEREFVKIIKDWAERHGVTYGTLRQLNVPAEVLKRAGMHR
jgi:hypothetical protein